MNLYDFEEAKEIIKEVERLKHKDRGLFKNDLLSIVQGVRVAYASVSNRKNADYYKRWFREQTHTISKMLEIKKETIWNRLKSKSKRI